MRFLLERLDEDDPVLFQAVLSGLHLGQYAAPEHELPCLRELRARELDRAAWTTAAWVEVDDEAWLPVREALLLERLRILERILLLLSFEVTDGSVLRAWGSWRGGSPQRRAFAVELLDSRYRGPDKGDILLLLEDLGEPVRLERLSARRPQESQGGAARLEALARGENAWQSRWPRATALDCMARGPGDAARSLASELADGPEELLATVARDALERLDGSPDGGRGLLDRVRFLSDIDVFSTVPADRLVEVARALRPVRLEAEEPLFAKGDDGTSLYLILEGSLRIHDGDTELATLGPGDIVGELSALDPEPRSASATAETDALLLSLSREQLERVVGAHLEVARGIIGILCARIRTTLGSAAPHAGAAPDDAEGVDGRGREDETLSVVERVLFLRSASFFKGSPSSVLAEVATLAREVALEEGASLFREGAAGSSLYIVVSGRLLIHRGEERIAELERKAIVGEMAALSSESRSASATALEQTRLLALSRGDIEQIMYTQPDVAHGIMRELVRRLRSLV